MSERAASSRINSTFQLREVVCIVPQPILVPALHNDAAMQYPANMQRTALADGEPRSRPLKFDMWMMVSRRELHKAYIQALQPCIPTNSMVHASSWAISNRTIISNVHQFSCMDKSDSISTIQFRKCFPRSMTREDPRCLLTTQALSLDPYPSFTCTNQLWERRHIVTTGRRAYRWKKSASA